ncbi:MAG: hypothetical protein WC364_14895 [Eubacteriales bacterium]
MKDVTIEQLSDMLWLAKLSILSFQRHFPYAEFLLLYNGQDFARFYDMFWLIPPKLELPLIVLNQDSDRFVNPYHFPPRGVWWKWVPFRYNKSKHEIAVDTDIICLSQPDSWFHWLEHKDPILIAPERYEKVLVNTCGDFYNHPLLVGKTPYNCGVVGQRANTDYSNEFFNITQSVKIGTSHNSMFITEQGAINLWLRSLELQGIKHQVLDFQSNAWVRDFLYFATKGVMIETVHAVTWYKRVISGLKVVFERKVKDDQYSQIQFVQDVLRESKQLDPVARHTLFKQIKQDSMHRDFLVN